ncbi:MAG: hypothetical protein KF862_21745 [Chitinophagaceae bacterium]|nr:hypothetical protein [Chitinophagaceae bacterium]
MKKFVVIYLVFAVSGCNKKVVTSESGNATDSVYTNIFMVQAGWDIYTGGVYRYGPSIIENDDGSIDAWFAAPGGTLGDRVLFYDEAGAQTAVALNDAVSAAQKFTAGEPFYAIAVACPNWVSTNSSLTLNLYRWKSNYTSTVASAPLATMVYSNYQDNQNLLIASDEKFSAGTYVWVLSDPSGTAGVWKKEGAMNNAVSFKNGEVVTGSYQAFLLLNPSSGVQYWDQASYMRSTDGGKKWSAEEMVLKPTEGSRDQFSVCDPGVVKYNGYYYTGYTSTEDERGVFNHAYVARSTSPNGPWEKWNGTAWGGNPQPVITFSGDADAWGAGEPCMVVNNDTLFFYYSWNGPATTETRVATASAADADWPAHLTLHGTAVNKTAIGGSDHCDIKYRDDLKKYYAIHTASRLTADSYIVLWESSDGLSFNKISEIRNGLKPYLHNCGWSGDERGHINPEKQQYLSYAYGPNWANWNTMWHPVTFK